LIPHQKVVEILFQLKLLDENHTLDTQKGYPQHLYEKSLSHKQNTLAKDYRGPLFF
jgi:hypothetical protein